MKYILAFILMPYLMLVAFRKCLQDPLYKTLPFDVAFVLQVEKFIITLKGN